MAARGQRNESGSKLDDHKHDSPKIEGQKIEGLKLHDSKIDAFQPRSTRWYSDLLIIESISEDCGDGGLRNAISKRDRRKKWMNPPRMTQS